METQTQTRERKRTILKQRKQIIQRQSQLTTPHSRRSIFLFSSCCGNGGEVWLCGGVGVVDDCV